MDPCKPDLRQGAREESASLAWLAAQRKCVYGGLTLDVDHHYIGSVTATTHQENDIITLEYYQLHTAKGTSVTKM